MAAAFVEHEGLVPANIVPHAVPCAGDSAKSADDGVWVFVPITTPKEEATAAQQRSQPKIGSKKIISFIKGRSAGARTWLASRVGAVLPGTEVSKGSVACAARVACQAVAERPEILAACLIGGAGLAAMGTRVLLRGGFVYYCFVPHFHFHG